MSNAGGAQTISQDPSAAGKAAAAARARALELLNDLRSAVAHHRAGRLDEAEALYCRLIEKVPGHPQASRLLGIIETERGRPQRAIELIGKAFPALASVPEVHIDLGNALHRAGRPEEAAEAYRQAIALRPNHSRAHTRLAMALNDLGRFEAAITHCQAALAIEPDFLPTRMILASALKGGGRMREAADVWRDIVARDPHRAESYHHLGRELADLGLYAEALSCHDRAIALQPAQAEFHRSRGEVLIHLHEGEKSVAAFRQAIALAPDAKPAWAGLSWALRLLGRFEEADACVKRLREIDPNDSLAVRHLPSEGQPRESEEIEHLVAMLDRGNPSIPDRITTGFALGRQLDNAGRFDEAFARYAAANALVRKNWPRTGDRFDAATFARNVDRLIEAYTPETLADAAASGSVSELPVFIVGMPRSGTTLIEQICASHSLVFGAGELNDISRLATTLAQEKVDRGQVAEARRQAADAHVQRLHALGRGAARVVDKMPDNVLFVGTIALLFPRARVIYCSRDARDISLSCYFQLFRDGAQFFSYDLADCARRCLEVQRLAAHWLQLLPRHMIEINYEALVADLEGESRRLIEFLGLDWEPACLDFHRTERTVATVSHWQVRQPLYGSSVGRWRNYENHLGPLLQALNGSAETPASATTADADNARS
jgi:tetratricopeptide (TPR) repeat protein